MIERPLDVQMVSLPHPHHLHAPPSSFVQLSLEDIFTAAPYVIRCHLPPTHSHARVIYPGWMITATLLSAYSGVFCASNGATKCWITLCGAGKPFPSQDPSGKVRNVPTKRLHPHRAPRGAQATCSGSVDSTIARIVYSRAKGSSSTVPPSCLHIVGKSTRTYHFFLIVRPCSSIVLYRLNRMMKRENLL